MKKYGILISTVILLLSILILSINMKEKYKISNLKINNISFAYEYSEKDIQDKLKIDMSMLNEFKVLSSLSNLECERIMIFSIKDGNMKKVKKKLVTYLNHLKEEYNESKHIRIIEQAKTYQKDDIYIVVISNNGTTIMKELKERLA